MSSGRGCHHGSCSTTGVQKSKPYSLLKDRDRNRKVDDHVVVQSLRGLPIMHVHWYSGFISSAIQCSYSYVYILTKVYIIRVFVLLERPNG